MPPPAPLPFATLSLTGTTLARAEFTVWVPPGLVSVRHVLVCAHYEDGRHVFDRPDWRAFAEEIQGVIVRHLIARDLPDQKLGKDDESARILAEGIAEMGRQANLPSLERAPLIFLGLSQAGWQAQAFAHRLAARTAAVVAWQPATGKRGPEEAAHPAAGLVPELITDAGRETFALRVPELHASARARGARWTYLLRAGAVHPLIGDGEFERCWLRAVLTSPGGPADWHGTWKIVSTGENDRHAAEASVAPGPGPADSTWLPGETVAHAWRSVLLRRSSP